MKLRCVREEERRRAGGDESVPKGKRKRHPSQLLVSPDEKQFAQRQSS